MPLRYNKSPCSPFGNIENLLVSITFCVKTYSLWILGMRLISLLAMYFHNLFCHLHTFFYITSCDILDVVIGSSCLKSYILFMLFQWLLLLLTDSCKCRFILCGLHVDAGTIVLLYSHDCSKIIVMMGVIIDTENWYNAATHWGPWLSHPITAWISSQKNWKKKLSKKIIIVKTAII